MKGIFHFVMLACFLIGLFCLWSICVNVQNYANNATERVENYKARCEQCKTVPLSKVAKNAVSIDLSNKDSVKIAFMLDTTFCERNFVKGDTILISLLIKNQFVK